MSAGEQLTGTFKTDSSNETQQIGSRLAAALRPGDVVLVQGELGAGKTTFVRGACDFLGVTTPVTSPTFVIGNRYQGEIPVAHLDLYRLGELALEDPGLIEDYIDADTVTFIEWPQAIPAHAHSIKFIVKLNHDYEHSQRRVIEIISTEKSPRPGS